MDYNNNILIEAKTELTNQFVSLLTPNIYDGFEFMYDDIIEKCKKKRTTEYLSEFQLSLKEIPNWSSQQIKEEYQKIANRCECDYLPELLTGVLVSTARVLSTIGTKTSQVNLKIPKIYKFIHQCYIHSAREFWKFTYLFDRDISKMEIQRNIRESEKIIENSIKQIIRSNLPVQNLLKEYLTQDDEEDDHDINEDINKIYQNNLKNMLRKNLESVDLQTHREHHYLGGQDSDPELETSVKIESLKPLNQYLNTTDKRIEETKEEETKFEYSSDNSDDEKFINKDKIEIETDIDKIIQSSMKQDTDNKDMTQYNTTTPSITTTEKEIVNNRHHNSNKAEIKKIPIIGNNHGIGNEDTNNPEESHKKYYDLDIPDTDSDSFEELNTPPKKNVNLEALFRNI